MQSRMTTDQAVDIPDKRRRKPRCLDNTEVFYSPIREHTNNGMLLPIDERTKQRKMDKADVWETKGTSREVMTLTPSLNRRTSHLHL